MKDTQLNDESEEDSRWAVPLSGHAFGAHTIALQADFILTEIQEVTPAETESKIVQKIFSRKTPDDESGEDSRWAVPLSTRSFGAVTIAL